MANRKKTKISTAKTLKFIEGNVLVHMAYTIDDDVKTTLFNDNIGKAAIKNDTTVEYVSLNDVKLIAESAFENCSELKIVEYVNKKQNSIIDSEAPKKLSDKVNIQFHAFKDCIKLHTVVFPQDYCVTIEKEAFMGCRELRTVVLNVTEESNIAEDAFSGCDKDKLVFIVTEGSFSERYAREHEYRFIRVRT